jgi:hypothetical protein
MIRTSGCRRNAFLDLIPAFFLPLSIGCSKSDSGSSNGGRGGNSTGTAGSSGSSQAGASASAATSASGGSSSKSSSSKSTPTLVTDLGGTQTIGSLSPTDASKLCSDTYAYFGDAISQADLCKWAGLAYSVSSSPTSDSVLRKKCTGQESTCLQANPAAAKCDPISATCGVTVAQYSACIADQAAAFNSAINGLPGCGTAVLSGLEGVWNAMTADLPESCAPLSNKCPAYNIPACGEATSQPMPPWTTAKRPSCAT